MLLFVQVTHSVRVILMVHKSYHLGIVAVLWSMYESVNESRHETFND